MVRLKRKELLRVHKPHGESAFGSHLITPAPVESRMAIGGPLGLFNTGTNLLCEVFKTNKLPGCSFYRQKHKPPAVVAPFSFHMGSTKFHRLWLHSGITS
jgi:hypothetical protein